MHYKNGTVYGFVGEFRICEKGETVAQATLRPTVHVGSGFFFVPSEVLCSPYIFHLDVS